MQIHLNTNRTQTLMPIVIDIEDAKSQPTLIVQPQNPTYTNESFVVDAKKISDGYQANFWLEQPGTYTVNITADNQTHTSTLQIEQHVFLPFGWEFGIFIVTLIFAFLGVYLWLKKKS